MNKILPIVICMVLASACGRPEDFSESSSSFDNIEVPKSGEAANGSGFNMFGGYGYKSGENVFEISNAKMRCTASFVHARLLVTAGHCVQFEKNVNLKEGDKIIIKGGKLNSRNEWINEEISLKTVKIWREINFERKLFLDDKVPQSQLDGYSDFAFIQVSMGSSVKEVFANQAFVMKYRNGSYFDYTFSVPKTKVEYKLYGWGSNVDDDNVYVYCSKKTGKKVCSMNDDQDTYKTSHSNLTYLFANRIGKASKATSTSPSKSMWATDLKFVELKSPTKNDTSRTAVRFPYQGEGGALWQGDSGASVFQNGGRNILGVFSTYEPTLDTNNNVTNMSNVYSTIDNNWYLNNIENQNVVDFYPKTVKANRAFLLYGRFRASFYLRSRIPGYFIAAQGGDCNETELNYPEIKKELAEAHALRLFPMCFSTYQFSKGEVADFNIYERWKYKDYSYKISVKIN